jgi:hypothetical protein
VSEDLSYREVRGVMGTGGSGSRRVSVIDGAAGNILIETSNVSETWLTPAEARCLARDLRRLARRIDARQALKGDRADG